MTKLQRNAAALEIVRRIITDLDRERTPASIDRNLELISSGKIGFGDICDDNEYIHAVLAERKLTPADVEECVASAEHTATWNEVCRWLPWAAGQLLQSRKGQNV